MAEKGAEGAFYGQGCYFAENACYSNHYGFVPPSPSSGGGSLRQLLLVSVLCGRSYEMAGRLDRSGKMCNRAWLRQNGYDSVRGGPHMPMQRGPGKDDSPMVAVYRANQTYPHFIASYRRIEPGMPMVMYRADCRPIVPSLHSHLVQLDLGNSQVTDVVQIDLLKNGGIAAEIHQAIDSSQLDEDGVGVADCVDPDEVLAKEVVPCEHVVEAVLTAETFENTVPAFCQPNLDPPDVHAGPQAPCISIQTEPCVSADMDSPDVQAGPQAPCTSIQKESCVSAATDPPDVHAGPQGPCTISQAESCVSADIAPKHTASVSKPNGWLKRLGMKCGCICGPVPFAPKFRKDLAKDNIPIKPHALDKIDHFAKADAELQNISSPEQPLANDVLQEAHVDDALPQNDIGTSEDAVISADPDIQATEPALLELPIEKSLPEGILDHDMSCSQADIRLPTPPRNSDSEAESPSGEDSERSLSPLARSLSPFARSASPISPSSTPAMPKSRASPSRSEPPQTRKRRSEPPGVKGFRRGRGGVQPSAKGVSGTRTPGGRSSTKSAPMPKVSFEQSSTKVGCTSAPIASSKASPERSLAKTTSTPALLLPSKVPPSQAVVPSKMSISPAELAPSHTSVMQRRNSVGRVDMCIECGCHVLAVAWASAGDHLAVASADCQVRILVASTGAVERALTLKHKVSCLAWSPEGERLAIGRHNRKLQVLAIASATTEQSLDHGDVVSSVAWSPDGRQVASGCMDGKLRVFDSTTGTANNTLDHGAPVLSVCFHPGGGWLATGCRDGRLRVFVLATGQVLHALPHGNWVTCVAWCPSGERLATGCDDGRLRFVNSATGVVEGTVEHSDRLWALAWAPGAERLVTACNDGRVRLIMGVRGTAKILRHEQAPVGSVAWGPAGDRLAVGCDDGSLRIFGAPA